MRLTALICSVALALVAATGLGEAATRHARTGMLTGTTKIETDCPVPSHLCKAWQPYPRARFTVVRLKAGGAAVAGTKRTVRSDASAHFRLMLRAGSYLVKPARAMSMRGGSSRTIRIQRGTTRTITVRFAVQFPHR
jgi:hypothetical protein